MTYQIKVLENTIALQRISDALTKEKEGSRFNIEEINVIKPGPRTKYIGGYLTLKNIRLKEAKPYSGNYPGPCLLGNRQKNLKYLEGLDWVEFNDLVNNVLDNLNLSADVLSSQCVMRLGPNRRVNYGMIQQGRLAQWDKKGKPEDFKDCRGKRAPQSKYPSGTPGLLVD